MAPSGVRRHRLPQRLDYTLIPAPLDLSLDSLPSVTEKSPLPAIIVTPSSPTSSRDFSIAFLARPPAPTLKERFTASFDAFRPSRPSLVMRARTILMIFILIFIIICHIVAHRLATRRPHLELSAQNQQVNLVESTFGKWFDFRSLDEDIHPEIEPEFIIHENMVVVG